MLWPGEGGSKDSQSGQELGRLPEQVQHWLSKEKGDVSITRRRNHSRIKRQGHSLFVNCSACQENIFFVKVQVMGSWEKEPRKMRFMMFFLSYLGRIWRKKNVKICKQREEARSQREKRLGPWERGQPWGERGHLS